MNVKEAVELAKVYVNDLFNDEKISNLGLEEVEFDDRSWMVTIGFSRQWDRPENTYAALAQQISSTHRTYKTVRIDDASGKVRSVKNRENKS